MRGIGPWHIRILCDHPWEGGFGYSPQQVGTFTLDQIFMLFANRKILRSRKKARTTKLPSLQASQVTTPDGDGLVKGRDKDGNPMRAKIGGKSLARQLMEAEAKEQEQEQDEPDWKKRSRKREERRKQRDLAAEDGSGST